MAQAPSPNAILLQEATLAYHNLMTGKMARVIVDSNGERVEFTATNAQRLYLYIGSLQALVDAENGLNPIVPTNAPAGFIF